MEYNYQGLKEVVTQIQTACLTLLRSLTQEQLTEITKKISSEDLTELLRYYEELEEFEICSILNVAIIEKSKTAV
jgi:hypothetical protein